MSTDVKTAVIRVLIVDDHPVVREALAHRIQRHGDLQVAGEAASVSEALEVLSTTMADVAVIDISLKDGDGIDLIKRIRAQNLTTKALVWSMYDASLYAERAMRAGALGYITKEHATEQIIDAIREVYQGRIFATEGDRESYSQPKTNKKTGASPIEELSDRELLVFRLMGEGLDMARIGDRLGLSVKTIETYRARIKQKLNIDNRMELIHAAVEWVLRRQISGANDGASSDGGSRGQVT